MDEIDISIYDTAHLSHREKQLSKQHRAEVASAMVNFANAMTFFQHSTVEQLRRDRLVRRESHGVLAVDQRGSDRCPPFPVRLYFYPWQDENGKHCIILTIGDKNRQQEDNNYCADCLRKLHKLSRD